MPPIRHHPPAGMRAMRANKTIRPTQPIQIVQTIHIGCKPRSELTGRARVLQAASGLEIIHVTILGRSAEYPSDDYLTLDSRADYVESITGVTPKAMRAAGAWPNDATVGAAVMAALESMAEQEVQPRRKKALKKTVSALSEIGVSGAGQFFGAALRQVPGL